MWPPPLFPGPRGRATRSGGFWLSEVLASLWLIAFVGAGLIGLFVYLAKASSVANERAAGELLADRLIERAVRVGPPHWGLEEGQVGQFLDISDPLNQTVLRFQLMPTLLEQHRLGRLYMLRVQVAWDETDQRRAERGRGELLRYRKVYIENPAVTP